MCNNNVFCFCFVIIIQYKVIVLVLYFIVLVLKTRSVERKAIVVYGTNDNLLEHILHESVDQLHELFFRVCSVRRRLADSSRASGATSSLRGRSGVQSDPMVGATGDVASDALGKGIELRTQFSP